MTDVLVNVINKPSNSTFCYEPDQKWNLEENRSSFQRKSILRQCNSYKKSISKVKVEGHEEFESPKRKHSVRINEEGNEVKEIENVELPFYDPHSDRECCALF